MGDVTRATREACGHLLTYTPTMGTSDGHSYDAVTGYLETVTRPYGTLLVIHDDAFGNMRTATGSLATLPTESAGDFRFQGMGSPP